MYEKTIQELAERDPRRVFPGMGLRLVARQVVVTGGAADLLMEDAAGTLWLIELKRDRLQPPDVDQLLRYADPIGRLHPGRPLRLMLAGPSVGPRTRVVASASGVVLHELDMAVLTELAQEHGVRDGAARPRRHGSPQRPSQPRGPGSTRQPNAARQQHQQRLDAAFPPGSIGVLSSAADLRAYWSMASPSAAPAMREAAVQLSLGVLSSLQGAALSNRASAWTCFRRGDGLVIASMEPKSSVCHMSFLLPDELAAELDRRGLVTTHAPRNGGTWVNCRNVTASVTPSQALAWYRAGLAVLAS